MGASAGATQARWRAAVALGGIAFLTSSIAGIASARSPAPQRFEIEWEAPEGCLDRDAARRAIETALGSMPSATGAATVVRVKIAETAAGHFSADIWMYDRAASGERSIEGTACEQVAQAAALIIAFVLQDSSGTSAPTTPAAASDERDDARTKPHASARASFAIGAQVAGDVGSLPQPDAGLALGLEARRARWRAELVASAWLPRTADIDTALGSGGQFTLYTGALRGCIDVLPARMQAVELGPCAGAEVGMTSGSGLGLAARRTEHVFWGAGLLGLSLRYVGAAPLVLGVLAELGAPVHRAAWQIDNFGTVFQASAVVGRTTFGVSWLFP